jgi:ribosomal protein S18 acetylase RimI-like enzyme
MQMVTRVATTADVPIIQRIVDAYQLSFDANEKRLGEAEALELIEGFFEPATTLLCRQGSSVDWDSFISLHPDENRERFYLDLYFLPDCTNLDDPFSLALSIARDLHPQWRLWLGVHRKDERYREMLERRGFSILRKYWLMEVELAGIESAHLPQGLHLEEVDFLDDQRRHDFWRVHQDSFSGHFGFKAREFENWSELLLRNVENMKNRVWLLSSGREPVGFVECTEELLHEETAYVAGLGVRQQFQGRGYGETLLRFVIRHEFDLGRKKLALNVDTGNESGALRLYEKVGMKPISEWHQYENLDWAQEEKSL